MATVTPAAEPYYHFASQIEVVRPWPRAAEPTESRRRGGRCEGHVTSGGYRRGWTLVRRYRCRPRVVTIAPPLVEQLLVRESAGIFARPVYSSRTLSCSTLYMERHMISQSHVDTITANRPVTQSHRNTRTPFCQGRKRPGRDRGPVLPPFYQGGPGI
jgi:hypothetical protein